MYKNSLDHHSPQMFKYSKRIFSSSPLPSINHPTHALARHVTPIRRNRILAVWRMFSGAISRNGGFEASLRWKERAMLAKRERIPVKPAIPCVIFIINPLDNNFLSFVDWNECRMHQIWREGRKGVSERQRGYPSPPPFPFSFRSLSHSPFVSTFRETIKNWSLFAPSQYCLLSSVVSRPVTQPFGSVLWSGKLSRVVPLAKGRIKFSGFSDAEFPIIG